MPEIHVNDAGLLFGERVSGGFVVRELDLLVLRLGLKVLRHGGRCDVACEALGRVDHGALHPHLVKVHVRLFQFGSW